jgi:hypothetical protein
MYSYINKKTINELHNQSWRAEGNISRMGERQAKSRKKVRSPDLTKPVAAAEKKPDLKVVSEGVVKPEPVVATNDRWKEGELLASDSRENLENLARSATEDVRNGSPPRLLYKIYLSNPVSFLLTGNARLTDVQHRFIIWVLEFLGFFFPVTSVQRNTKNLENF